MTHLGKLAAALITFASVVGGAGAQSPGPFGGGGWFLLINKSVQRELQVTDQQAQQLGDLVRDAQAKVAARIQDLNASPPDERRGKFQDLARASNEELRAGLAKVLRPQQFVRFDQIATRAAGLEAFSLDRVRLALKPTPEQDKELREIASELRDSLLDAQGEIAKDRAAAMKKIAALRRSSIDRAVALMNDDQKAAWKDLTGEPFEPTFEPR